MELMSELNQNSKFIKVQEHKILKKRNKRNMLEGFFSNFFGGNEQFNENQRLEKLRNQLMTCTYYIKYILAHKFSIKFLIERICMDLMKASPNFKAEILAFSNIFVMVS